MFSNLTSLWMFNEEKELRSRTYGGVRGALADF